jgi:hypothetical protein
MVDDIVYSHLFVESEILPPKDYVEPIILGLSLFVAIIAAVIATWSIRSQTHALKWRANHDFHLASLDILARQPDILRFHGVSLTDLERDGLSLEDLIYLCLDFDAGDTLYEIGGDRHIDLTDYRKRLLDNDQVRQAWTKYLRNGFFNRTSFSKAVDAYIAAKEAEIAMKKEAKI